MFETLPFLYIHIHNFSCLIVGCDKKIYVYTESYMETPEDIPSVSRMTVSYIYNVEKYSIVFEYRKKRIRQEGIQYK